MLADIEFPSAHWTDPRGVPKKSAASATLRSLFAGLCYGDLFCLVICVRQLGRTYLVGRPCLCVGEFFSMHFHASTHRSPAGPMATARRTIIGDVPRPFFKRALSQTGGCRIPGSTRVSPCSPSVAHAGDSHVQLMRKCHSHATRNVMSIEKEMVMAQPDRITREPDVMGGKACIRGMRVTVGMVLSQIGAGHSVEEVLADFPYLEREDILQAIRYAAWQIKGSRLDIY